MKAVAVAQFAVLELDKADDEIIARVQGLYSPAKRREIAGRDFHAKDKGGLPEVRLKDTREVAFVAKIAPEAFVFEG